jgi:hypothetical protein
MGACLNVLENMAMLMLDDVDVAQQARMQPYKDLVPSLVSILKQVGVCTM